MSPLQKTISFLFLATFLGSFFSPAFALTNKETTISFVDSLRTSISAGIASREKTLSDRANELWNRYDTTIQSLGFRSDEIEALTSIKKLGVPAFRQDIAQAYLGLKQTILQDIKSTQDTLALLRDEIALGYTDLSPAQKQYYDEKVSGIQTQYATFLSGSTASIDTFVNAFSGRILADTQLVKQMMDDNKEYILFIRDIRNSYEKIEEKKKNLLAKKEIFEKELLPKVQGGFVVFSANKKILSDAVRKDLTEGLEKALLQERLKKQETELRGYTETLINKWSDHLAKNFWQDDELIQTTKDMENILLLEKTLHQNIYDATGNIRSLEMSGSTVLLDDISKMETKIVNFHSGLVSLIASYGTGNTLSSLNDNLIASYKTELVRYRADLTKFLEEKFNSLLLEEKNYLQTLSLLDQEERILKQSLEISVSLDFMERLVNDFHTKINTLAESNGQEGAMQKAQMLTNRYLHTITQKKIGDAIFARYYGKRTALDASLANIFDSLEKKYETKALLTKLSTVSQKIDTLLAEKKFSTKNHYTLLVVQSNIFKYLEDAAK